MNQIPFRPQQAEIERNKRLVYWEKKKDEITRLIANTCRIKLKKMWFINLTSTLIARSFA